MCAIVTLCRHRHLVTAGSRAYKASGWHYTEVHKYVRRCITLVAVDTRPAALGCARLLPATRYRQKLNYYTLLNISVSKKDKNMYEYYYKLFLYSYIFNKIV